MDFVIITFIIAIVAYGLFLPSVGLVRTRFGSGKSVIWSIFFPLWIVFWMFLFWKIFLTVTENSWTPLGWSLGIFLALMWLILLLKSKFIKKPKVEIKK